MCLGVKDKSVYIGVYKMDCAFVHVPDKPSSSQTVAFAYTLITSQPPPAQLVLPSLAAAQAHTWHAHSQTRTLNFQAARAQARDMQTF